MMSLRAKEEYLRAVHARYRQATREAKGQILDEFCATTGYHRKSALRLLHGPPPGRTRPARRRRALRTPCTALSNNILILAPP